jgi:hypothetical protein
LVRVTCCRTEGDPYFLKEQNSKNIKAVKKSLLVFLFIFSWLFSFSQDSSKISNKWHWLIEPYVMAANLNGTVGIGQLPDVSVSATPGDIFSHLQMGAMLNIEASHGNWTITSDILYMNLKQDVQPNKLIVGGAATAKQFAWELAGLYRLNPWLEAGVSSLLNSVNAGLNVQIKSLGGNTRDSSASITKTWVAPMLIVRVGNKAGQNFLYSLRAEIGGLGSGLTWQIQAYAGYRFTRLFQLTGGYRVIGVNYGKGSGGDRFLYDMNTFGPVIRLGFNF